VAKQKVKSIIPQLAFITLLVILLVLSFLVAKPFLIALITGGLLAFIFYPLHKFFLRKTKKPTLSAIITTLLVLLFIAIPFLVMGNMLAKETATIFVATKEKIIQGQLIPDQCAGGGLVCDISNKVNAAFTNPETRVHVVNFLNKLISFIAEKIGQFIISIPKIILNMAIALFATFYFLRDGEKFLKLIKKIAPMKLHHQQQLLTQLKETIKALVFGTIIVAIIQGLLAILGFLVFSVPNPIWWGFVTMFFALIPFVGAWLVWFPASLYLFLSGYMTSTDSLIWKGVGLAIFGIVIISQIDNLLKPVLVGGKAKVHPLLIFVGVLGGLLLFGFIGIILGPILLAMLQKIIQIYAKEITPHLKDQPGILGKHHK